MLSLGSPATAPTGTVALVFTDIEGSTQLWERCSTSMREALELHDRVMRERLRRTSGYEVKTQGDSFMLAFPSVDEALRWCLDVQETLLHVPWPAELLAQPLALERMGPRGLLHRGLRVRMGVHVGEPECRPDPRTGQMDYFGPVVNLTARVAEAGHGGQVLLSGAALAHVAGTLDALGSPSVRPLGEFRLKGITLPVPLVEVLPSSLADRRFAGLRVPEERRGNVPTAVDTLIGREQELACLRRWFEEGVHLITLLGPGGMGKTRLATHFGATQLQARRWDGGVWWCDLTEARTEEDICHALARALDVSLTRDGDASRPAERLGRALAGCGASLVLLDNVEQVIHHMPHTLGRWLSLAPHTRFLVTSRHALQLPGEQLLDLAPLELPAEGEVRLEELARSEAVQLFAQRARAVRGSFELTEQEAPLVADIVRRLDGIALAIELAAARTNLLSIQQLRNRLPRRFELLSCGLREASHRQATLRGAIDWSWNLLEASEQEALAQCSVFRGGFTMEAAEAVLALPPWGGDILDTLQSLRSKSLLKLSASESTDGELRLGMYESIREYACARLAETGGNASIVARHAEYYVTRARGLRDQVRGGGGLEALRALALERENLLAACDSCLMMVPGTAESLTRALLGLVALEPDVAARGPAGLLLPRLELALELAESVPVEPMLRTEALAVRGRAHLEAGQLTFARRDLEAARDAFHLLGAMAWKKEALVDLSIVARHEGDMDAAWSLIQEAQTIPSGTRRWLEAYALGNLGLVEQSRQGAEAAIPHLRAALELFRAVGDTTFEAMFLVNCGLAIGEAGRTAEAVPYLEEGLAKSLSAGYRMGHIVARMDLGCVLLGEDRAAEACEHLAAAERMGRQLGIRLLEGMTRGELGRALLAVGTMEPARAQLSAAVAVLEPVSRSHALRFSAYHAAAHALAGALTVARQDFNELEAAPELRNEPALRALTSLLRATVEVAELRAAPPGTEEAWQAEQALQQRLERARTAPAAETSSDLRGALRLLERWREAQA
ncbi:ATP-binding protein [Hyalangium minutum]|uniref:Transcriptional regulator, LuxR family protein n=1 Tax=Hyalangium minutum TaxID=394096 RepID=A0A085WSV7_9BACT|nr:adenylate/guanylate cyclase domain-containing protein [Hyalangium minutum]KFE70770.1 transcriptional regulator, LuxR family protein [Hyalangium minutum]